MTGKVSGLGRTSRFSRIMRAVLRVKLVALTMAMVFSAPLMAQQGAPAPQPSVTAPVPAPIAPPVTAPPAEAATPPAAAPSPAASSPSPAAPAAAEPAPDASKGADSAGMITEVAARPVLRLKGRSTWDDGFGSLKASLAALDAEVKKLGLATDGPSMAHFVDSDDNGFTYEAMAPLKEAVAAGVTLSAGMDATLSPSGKAVVFRHEGAYDDIDSAYEAFTAWLDDKNLVSTGRFLEEYLFWPEKSDDTTMKLKITVFLKERVP